MSTTIEVVLLMACKRILSRSPGGTSEKSGSSLKLVSLFLLSLTVSCTVDIPEAEAPPQAEILETELVWLGTDSDLGIDLMPGPLRGAISGDTVVLVRDRMSPAIWRIDLRDNAATRVGRAGDGPGEYRSPFDIGFFGDSVIWAADSRGRVIEWQAGTLQPLRTRTIPAEIVPGTDLRAIPAVLLESGHVLATASLSSPPQPGQVTHDVPIALWSPEGDLSVVDWVRDAPFSGRYIYGTEDRRMNRITNSQPFAGFPILAPGPLDGEFFVLTRAPDPTQEVPAFRIQRFQAGHQPSGQIEIEYEPIPTDGAWRERTHRVAGAFAEMMDPDPQMGEITEETVMEATWMPETLPPVQQAYGDPEGFWFQRELRDPDDETVRWSRHDLSGTLIGQVELPRRFEGMAAQKELILGFEPNEFQLPDLFLYRVDLP